MNFWTAEANLRRIWRIQFESQIKCPSAAGRKKRVPTFFFPLWSSLTSAHTKREVETGFSKGLYGLLTYVAIYPYKNSTSMGFYPTSIFTHTKIQRREVARNIKTREMIFRDSILIEKWLYVATLSDHTKVPVAAVVAAI